MTGKVCTQCGYTRKDDDSGSPAVCPKCDVPYAWGKVDVPSPGPARRRPMVRTEAPSGGLRESMGAAVMMAIGCFAPIFSAPVVGAVNYIGHGNRDGVIVLAMALLGVALAFAGWVRWLILTGGVALAVSVFDLVALMRHFNQATGNLEASAVGNPFGGIAVAMAKSFQIQWGWIPLIAGAALMIAVGFGFKFKAR